MTKRRERTGLGRGLSALMADIDTQGSNALSDENALPTRAEPRLFPIEKIRPNEDQPRRAFSSEALSELAASIREKGIIQPLILRPDPSNTDYFQIVAGERRWRAAQQAQLHEVPAIMRDFSDTEVLEVAIIENIQRADLNALEEANGYRQLMDRFDHTQEQLAKAMGKSRSHIANLLRLLTLPEPVQNMVRDGSLSAGHARAVITSEDPVGLARIIAERGLSVREAEQLSKTTTTKNAKSTNARRPSKDADTIALENNMSATLKMPVTIQHDTANGGGRLTIQYKDLEALDDLIRVLGG